MTTTRRKRRTRAGASMLLTMMLTAALPVRASAQLTCGGTIGPGGTFTLSNDLTSCPGTGLTPSPNFRIALARLQTTQPKR